MNQPYQDEVRCARCQTWNPVHNLRHGYCLDCVSSVYLLAGNWCVQHGPFPLQVVKVGEIGDTGMVLEAPKPRDEQQCPWCDFRCHRHDVALAWGDYCVQCQVDAVAVMAWITTPRKEAR